MSHENEPATDPELLEVLAELKSREAILHQPEPGAGRGPSEEMMASDFWEVGASGRRYGRAQVLDVLEERAAADSPREPWKAFEFHCRRLAQDVYLLTYALIQDGGRRTRRSSIWERAKGEWKIVYHQGTLLEQ